VRTVVAATNGEQQDVEAENVGEVEGDGDGACSMSSHIDKVMPKSWVARAGTTLIKWESGNRK
jgi:hypothetical protein